MRQTLLPRGEASVSTRPRDYRDAQTPYALVTRAERAYDPLDTRLLVPSRVTRSRPQVRAGARNLSYPRLASCMRLSFSLLLQPLGAGLRARQRCCPGARGSSVLAASAEGSELVVAELRSELSPLSFLERSEFVYPDKVAVVHEDRRYTYREMGERVRRLASALLGAGLEKGDRVAFIAPNIPALLEAHYGVPAAGACWWPSTIA